ncbi:tyrosine protein phosphatase [Lactococcus hodotermopsidis]|uniref:Tyrosine-protein phosphatase n=1 Tax=Pseudolactococcus hodotermopsidis TaxID=2709157 RepID=A0A6A0BAP4_9LACT|nr:CpsB/CapC family capsule biosynthesis tyrosine phosphatase [Lactococcus hodotermopsidis]GFH41876.1 tyrosine protein phosphatase [Lactococcus hodotermopsidis]
MIDLHCHILPNIDDGPDSVAAAVAMAKKAVNQGIQHVLCTPHYNDKYHNKKNEIISAVDELQFILDDKKIPLKLYEGQEVRIFRELEEAIARDEILFADVTDRYLLVEFPSDEIPIYAERLMYDLRVKEIVPIIVHPERNRGFQKDTEAIYSFLSMGCLAQLTAPSLIGRFGKEVQKLSHHFVANHIVQMIASDAHGINKRNFYLKEAYQYVARHFGHDLVHDMKEVSRSIINGDEVSFTPYK